MRAAPRRRNSTLGSQWLKTMDDFLSVEGTQELSQNKMGSSNRIHNDVGLSRRQRAQIEKPIVMAGNENQMQEVSPLIEGSNSMDYELFRLLNQRESVWK